MAVSVDLLDEGDVAVGAGEQLFFPVRFLVVQHVAQLRSFDVAEHALEQLVGASSLLVFKELLHEAHVAGITTEPVTDSLFDDLAVCMLERDRNPLGLFIGHTFEQFVILEGGVAVDGEVVIATGSFACRVSVRLLALARNLSNLDQTLRVLVSLVSLVSL